MCSVRKLINNNVFSLQNSISLDAMRPTLFFAVLTVLSLPYKCHAKNIDQCPAQPAIYGKALKGYTFKTLVTSSSKEC